MFPVLEEKTHQTVAFRFGIFGFDSSVLVSDAENLLSELAVLI